MISNKYIIPTSLFNSNHSKNLDLEAISFFAASGFFLENSTYWKDGKWDYLNFDKNIWSHEARDISLEQAVDEFATLFHQIVAEQTQGKKVILALSGGLDSRTLAVAMQQIGHQPYTYSYRFEGSFEETKYGKQIAKIMDWDFDEFVIPSGYLWNKINDAAKINQCYAEFTHARQVAVAEQIAQKGDLWLLGHWGDVLFDDMGVDKHIAFEEQVSILYKKIIKKGGIELATDLWKAWNLPGNFEEQLRGQIKRLHQRIEINDPNARIRAFKSMYWATRWTSTNLQFFNHHKPMVLPYYDDRMCRFVMSMPEEHLAGRKIQIEYIKKYSPQLAGISWQAKEPFNLYNYSKHQSFAHLPYRIAQKAIRDFNTKLLKKKFIQRNWEIQFIGKKNDAQLRKWLFENEHFTNLVPSEITEKYYRLFQSGDKVYWSHAVSILLTLSVFSKQNKFSHHY
jgi:asparagine synthetase B (glutamine-hydrolysing)